MRKTTKIVVGLFINCLWYNSNVIAQTNDPDVPYFSQKDPRWEDEDMVSSSYKIRKWGCTTTSVTMLFNYYGVNASSLTFDDYFINDTNPQDFNTYLRNSYNYSTSSDCYNCIIWPNTVNYSNAQQKSISYQSLKAWTRRSGENILNVNIVNEELSKGYPVVVKVYTGFSDYQWHWVIVKKKQGNSYLINDPNWLERKNLSAYSNRIYAARFYEGPLPS